CHHHRLYTNRCTCSMEFPMKKLRSRSFRPNIESLEDRAVPATFAPNTFDDVVNPADDARVLSLREAINKANATPGADVIRLQAGTYRMRIAGQFEDANAAGDFDVRDSLTITGAGAATVIDGGAASLSRDRLFDVLGPINMSFVNLTLRNGGNSQL